MRIRHFELALSICTCLLLFTPIGTAQDAQEEKHIKTALRMIGHQVLLKSNDSTSRVLPIIKENDQYRIQFESEFKFKPTELVSLIDSIVTKTSMASSYIVEVQQCDTGKIVYGFQMDDSEQLDIIPCGLRMQPKACYNLLFTLITINETDVEYLPVSSDSANGSNSGIESHELYNYCYTPSFNNWCILFYKKAKKESKKQSKSNSLRRVSL